MSLTLQQMETIATNLQARVKRLEERKFPASYAPENNFYITNAGATLTTMLSAKSAPVTTEPKIELPTGGPKEFRKYAPSSGARLINLEFQFTTFENEEGRENTSGAWGELGIERVFTCGWTVTGKAGKFSPSTNLFETVTVLVPPTEELILTGWQNASAKGVLVKQSIWNL